MNGRRSAVTFAALLFPALTAGGCSAGAWRDVGHDFAQVFDASFSVGPGFAAHVRATELVQAGFGSFDGATAGLMDGRFEAAHEQRSELGVSLLHTYEYRRDHSDLLDVRHPYYADPGFEEFPLSWEMESDRHDADLGLGLHVAYIGTSATLHLDELWDFVAGCFGFDPLRDDAWSRDVAELRKQAQSLDAAERNRAFDALLRRGEPIHGYAIYTASGVRPSYQRRAMEAIRADDAAATGAADR